MRNSKFYVYGSIVTATIIISIWLLWASLSNGIYHKLFIINPETQSPKQLQSIALSLQRAAKRGDTGLQSIIGDCARFIPNWVKTSNCINNRTYCEKRYPRRRFGVWEPTEGIQYKTMALITNAERKPSKDKIMKGQKYSKERLDELERHIYGNNNSTQQALYVYYVSNHKYDTCCLTNGPSINALERIKLSRFFYRKTIYELLVDWGANPDESWYTWVVKGM